MRNQSVNLSWIVDPQTSSLRWSLGFGKLAPPTDVLCSSSAAGALKWYICQCRPGMIVDLFIVQTGLCFQSLLTFYCRFHCRPLNHFGLWPSCNTKKRMKWTIGSKYGLCCEHAQWRLQNLQHFDFRPSSTKQCSKKHCKAKTILFSYQNPPMPNRLSAYVHHNSRWVARTMREGLTWLERIPELHDGFQFQTRTFRV